MSNSTTYIDYSASTPIKAAWLNDVNQLTYVVCGDVGQNPPTTAAQLVANLGLATSSGVQTLTNKTLLAATNTVEAASGPNTTPLGSRNVLINSNFGINQLSLSGTVTLAAGADGHDMWFAGAGGCTYTFAKVNNVTTVTITAGTLKQCIEGEQLQSGTYTLSWTGTATGRIDSGAYGASGITGTAVGGTNQVIEFGTGTVSKVQYEPGSVKTPWAPYNGIYGGELQGCQRYYEIGTSRWGGYSVTGNNYESQTSYKVQKRVIPTVTAAHLSGLYFNATPVVAGNYIDGHSIYETNTSGSSLQSLWVAAWTASARLHS